MLGRSRHQLTPRRSLLAAVAVFLALATPLTAADAARLELIGAPSALEILPATITLDGPRATCQVVVTGRYIDGSRRDLTAVSEYRAEANLIAVEPTGYLRARRDGDT